MTNSTRQRLLDAAVELLLTEGSAGITTGRLTEQAGVVQSAFYNHFSSVAACKAAALAEVEREILLLSGGIGIEFEAEGSTAVEDAERVLLVVFAAAAERPALFRMLTHRRHEPDIEAAVDQLLAGVHGDISAALQAETSRLRGMSAAETDTCAALLTSIAIACIEQVFAGAPAAHVAHLEPDVDDGARPGHRVLAGAARRRSGEDPLARLRHGPERHRGRRR